MGYKLKISKAGYNVLTETSPDNLVLDSDYDTLKYHASGSVNVTVSGADAEQSIEHDLGYVPFFTAFVNYFADPVGTAYNMCPGTWNDVGNYCYAQCYATTTRLYFKVFTNSASQTFTFKYKIFRNTLGL